MGFILRILSAIRPLIDRFLAVGFIQQAIVLAAQAFMALFPLLIGVIALAPTRTGDAISTFMRRRLGLAGDTADDVSKLVATRSELRSGITVIGLLVILASATSFTRALQRVYENAWQLPKGGVRGSIRGFFWLVGLTIYIGMLSFVLEVMKGGPAISLLRLILIAVTILALWLVTPFILLCGRVRLRALAFTAILTAAAIIVSGAVSADIMPHIVSSNERQFGTIGVVFAVQTWLVVLGGIIVGASVIGAYATQADDWFGTLARGSADRESWRRTPTGWFARRGRSGKG